METEKYNNDANNVQTVRNDLSIEYIAGIFDGEGSVSMYSNSNQVISPKAAIVGTYRPMVESIFETLKIGGFSTQKRQELHKISSRHYTTDISKTNKENDIRLCKQGWKWTITSKVEMKEFLTKIYPFLMEKKEQVKVCLDFLDGKLDGKSAIALCKKYKKFQFPSNSFVSIRYKDNEKISTARVRLKDADIVDIYSSYYLKKQTKPEIRSKYVLSKDTLDSILYGRSWKHITQNIVV